jgi:hypothetical protein
LEIYILKGRRGSEARMILNVTLAAFFLVDSDILFRWLDVNDESYCNSF